MKLYEETVPLFDKADIETEIRDLFKRRCDLPSGGYLIIEPTEALVSIDVNSGPLHRQEGSREDDPQDQHRRRRARSRASSGCATSAASSSATSSTWRRRRTATRCSRSCARTSAATAPAPRRSR